MAWASEIPEELLTSPRGLVVLTGLDTTYNAVHKAIWDAFCNNRRADRVPLNLVVKPTDYEYPRCKAKKSTYEFYIPRGILKTHWLRKTLNEVPSVVVLFWDLDWDDVQWREKSMECATKVEILRASIEGRSTRVCVVLIQRNPPLPPGEDVVAAERASSLCSACNLHAKSLFVLPLSDHLLGYAVRLENAFYETSLAYYQSEIRKVKSHRDFLNKTTHQFLYVRHQFKIAFYNEMRQDLHNAIKHYRQAYSHILECRMYDTNMLEIKVIAGFITIKICRLLFLLNTPLDSISFFRKHIDFFKTRLGPIQLTFEHSAWMSEQFQLFGELFEEATRMGLTAVQTQHPGFYFQQAAQMGIIRKEQSTSLCKHSEESIPDMEEQLRRLDYYGQRPWRQGYQTIEAPDPAKEREGIQTLQAMECKVNYPDLIIPLLQTAVAQFKKYKSPRIKRLLLVRIAEQLLDAKNYSKALLYCNRVMPDYRNERWWLLLKDVISKATRSAYMACEVQDLLQLFLESLSPYCEFSVHNRSSIQESLMNLMQGKSFNPPLGCDKPDSESVKEVWEKKHTNSYTINMQNITSCIEVKASFLHETLPVDETIVIKLFIRSLCPLPIIFNTASLQLTPQSYNFACSNGITDNLILHSDQVKVLTFTCTPVMEDVNKELEIRGISLFSKPTEEAPELILSWAGCKGEAVAKSNLSYNSFKKPVAVAITDTCPWATIEPIGKSRLKSRESRVKLIISHSPPCLINEVYAMQICIHNEESTDIQNFQLSSFVRDGEGGLGLTVEDIPSNKSEVGPHSLPILKPEEEHSINLYFTTFGESSTRITVVVTYDIKVQEDQICHCRLEEAVIIPAVKPFTFTTSLLNMKCYPLDSVTSHEIFLTLIDVACSSPWPIDIATTNHCLTSAVQLVDREGRSQLQGAQLQCGDCASETQAVKVITTPFQKGALELGTYQVKWRRSHTDLPFVNTTTNLPSVTWEHLPVTIETELPAIGRCRQPLNITYHLHNHTVYSQEAEVQMGKSESFLFAGQLKHHMRLMPGSRTTLDYKLVPMFTGKLDLPQLQLGLNRFPGLMDSKLQHRMPSHLFVMPSGRISEAKG